MAICSNEELKKYLNDIFVETGSHQGDSIQLALDCGFKEVHSIELHEGFFNFCKNRFKDMPNVKLYLGDSAKDLNMILSNINKRCTFWLDGHYSGPATSIGIVEFPILEELNAIKNHPIKDHTILIDDIRCWNNIFFKIEDIKNLISSINPNYKFLLINGFVENDIIVAYV
jgi:hypothetical protein